MRVLNLRCAHGHAFEGWFGSDGAYAEQLERRLVACPLCGDVQIERMPTAARLSLSSSRESAAAKARKAGDEQRDAERASAERASAEGKPPAESPRTDVALMSSSETPGMEALWLRAVRHVLDHTEDVGTRFADEARRIHYGEVPGRGIRGQASADETEALRDEGIEVHALPIPSVFKGPEH